MLHGPQVFGLTNPDVALPRQEIDARFDMQWPRLSMMGKQACLHIQPLGTTCDALSAGVWWIA